MSAAEELANLMPPPEQRARPSATAKRELDAFFARVLGVDNDTVYTTQVSKAGNLRVRFDQSPRARRSEFSVALVPDGTELDPILRAAEGFVGPGRRQAVLIVGDAGNGPGILAVIEPSYGRVGARLTTEWPSLDAHIVAPTRPAPPTPRTAMTVPLAMDARTARMARLAVVTSPAVLFVGPPGTGKNRLLAEILSEIEAEPTSYGFRQSHEIVIEPADEGWTTRDLVGGETVDERSGLLRFRPGRVLDAVANDRWLVIDEANRADLDRIFGGLLTWLSGQQVIVGRASTKVGAPLVRLGWSEHPSSHADGVDRLAADDVGADPIDYWAGTEFRLLGTYNALDAQRVFRFGLALGRRFAQVPVPPAAVSDFEVILAAQTANLDEALRDRVAPTIVSLYRGHLETRGAQLGPAMFLGLAEYVAKGLELRELGIVDHEDEHEIDRLLAEAYLLSAGSWLARLDPHSELPALAARLTEAEDGAISPEQWNWVAGQLETIGG